MDRNDVRLHGRRGEIRVVARREEIGVDRPDELGPASGGQREAGEQRSQPENTGATRARKAGGKAHHGDAENRRNGRNGEKYFGAAAGLARRAGRSPLSRGSP